MSIMEKLGQAGLDAAQAEVLVNVARQQLMRIRVGSINGSVIYQVRDGWQLDLLRDDENVVLVTNSAELEGAVQNHHVYTIFVPKNAALTQEVTERVLQRNALDKTVFWEV